MAIWNSCNVNIPRSLNSHDSFLQRKFLNWAPTSCRLGSILSWSTITFGTEVGLGPGHIALDGNPSPIPQNRPGQPPIFDPCLLWPNGWTDQDETWHGGRPWPGDTVFDGDPAPVPRRGTATQFSAHVCCGQTAGSDKSRRHLVGRWTSAASALVTLC